MHYHNIPISDIDDHDLSFWQSMTWANILIASLQAQEVFYYGNIHSAPILVEIRSIGLGFLGAFSLGVSQSQIGDDWDDLISDLQQYLKEKNILFLQIEPIGNIDLGFSDTHCTCKTHNSQKPYKKFLTPHTQILNLALTEEELLAQMHEKCRYNIRLAQKRGVTIDMVPPTPENIDIWIRLLEDTTTRNGFSGNSRLYYEVFLTLGGGELYFARYDGRVIAAGIWITTKTESIYYYGTSSSADRRHMAPYLLQWTAIQHAKNRNIPFYDFLGVADPSDPTDLLIGVTEFKSRFGGEMVTLPGKILIPLSWKYRVFISVQKIKNLLKRR